MNQMAQTLSTNDALILQCIDDVEMADIQTVASDLSQSTGKTLARIKKLKRKGFIFISNKYGSTNIGLTNSSKQTIHFMWPDAIR